MTRCSHRALWLVLAALLLASAPPAHAVQPFAPLFNGTDPAQLAAAAALFVKVDSKSGTDTILVVNRQQAGDLTTTGTAITVHLRFYDADCHLVFDNNVNVTPQGIGVGLVSTLFGVDEPGVVLADSYAPSSAALATTALPAITTQFALSGIVIDGNFGALYERQGSPLLEARLQGGNQLSWAGFSADDIDDWFIGGFTMLQMMCPLEDGPGTLGNDMHDLANGGDAFAFANLFPVVNVYDAKEVLKRSIHEVPCFCNTDSAFFGADSRGTGYPGDFADVLVSMKAVGLGTFHWDDPTNTSIAPPVKLIAWRVISDGKAVYWDARLRTTSPLCC